VGNGVGQEGSQRPAVRAGAGGAVLQQLFHPLARKGERGVDVLAGGGFPVQLGEGAATAGSFSSMCMRRTLRMWTKLERMVLPRPGFSSIASSGHRASRRRLISSLVRHARRASSRSTGREVT
jgi:hypothetical protein